MSHINLCLNCNNITSGKFCNNCGQKTDTQRITLKHFVFHDLLHGVWHIEKGIIYTLKEALISPGRAALDYISGKRIRYYNVFYLVLLVIGLSVFLNSLFDYCATYFLNSKATKDMDKAGNLIDAFFSSYAKFIIFSFVPLLALNSYLIFKKSKLNLSEHFIIAGMIFLGVMTITVFNELLFFVYFFKNLDFIFDFLNIAVPIIILLFVVKNYHQTFKNSYSKKGILLNTFLFMVIFFIELFLLAVLMIGYFSNWTFKLKLVYA